MVHMPEPPVEEVKHAAEEEGVMEVRNLREGSANFCNNNFEPN